MENNFIKKLLLAGGEQYEAAKVVEATETYARWWDVNVQSIIRQDQTRPDHTWDWVKLVKGTHPAVLLARFSGQRPRSFCVVVADKYGRTLPIGMILLVEKYVYLPDHGLVAPFTWFLAGAPSSFLKEKLDGKRPRLLPALVDIGIVVSFEKGCQGRLGLHSAPEGGVALLEKYKECGLKQLPHGSKLPIGRGLWRQVTQADDSINSYLYSDTDSANQIMTKARYGSNE